MNHPFKKAVTFSYDDGITQDRKLVEIFNHFGMKATFNLNTGIQSPDSNFLIENVHIFRMPQEGLKELYQGHEIAVHGLTHSGLTGLSRDELEKEFLTDAKNIEKFYGRYPVGMAYAYGDCPEEAVSYLSEIGIRYGRTTEATHGFALPENPMLLKATCHHKDEALFSLAEQFLREEGSFEKPLLFYVWGHSYEFDVDDNWDRIEKLCEMLSGKENIFYGTNAECLNLI